MVEAGKYKGVRKRKWGKWVSEIRLPNSRERIWLGSYDTPEKAARAFDAALFCLRGNTASFNFPQQPPDIPGGRSLPPSQIQAVAARFANHHSSSNSSSSTSLLSSSEEEEKEEESIQRDITTWFVVEDLAMAMAMAMAMNNNGEQGVPDFGIYPGFDDYFMPRQPDYEYEYDYSDGIYLQGTGQSFLWNF